MSGFSSVFFYGWGSRVFCFIVFFSQLLVILSLIFCIIQNYFNIKCDVCFLLQFLWGHSHFCNCEQTVTFPDCAESFHFSYFLCSLNMLTSQSVSQSSTLVQTLVVPRGWRVTMTFPSGPAILCALCYDGDSGKNDHHWTVIVSILAYTKDISRLCQINCDPPAWLDGRKGM